MQNLIELYDRSASKYEDLTVNLSVQVDTIIFALRNFESTFKKLDSTADDISESPYRASAGLSHESVRQELDSLLDTVTTLKATVKTTLESVTETRNEFLIEAEDRLQSTDEIKKQFYQQSVSNFNNTLSQCISLLEEIDVDLFKTEIRY